MILTGFKPLVEPGAVNPGFPFSQPNRFNQTSQTDSWTAVLVDFETNLYLLKFDAAVQNEADFTGFQVAC